MTNDPRIPHEADSTVKRADPASPRSQRRPTRVSRLSVPAFAVAFLAGLANGAVSYAHRSPVIAPRTVNSMANEIEISLAIAAAAVVAAVQRWRTRNPGRRGPSPWLAPFSAPAVARVRQAFRSPHGTAALRVPLMAVLILGMLYVPWRAGDEVTDGLDPNSVVNAWGGPTYIGAVLAHWLDGIVIFYVAALLLGRLAQREPTSS